MSEQPWARLSGVVLGCPDPHALAGFYQQLLGWSVAQDEPDWVKLDPPGGGAGLSFQTETQHVPAVWPAGPGDQQMQVHLDIEVDDLARAAAYVESLGARRARWQPQERVLVYQDPAGHPFCIWVPD